MLALRECCRDDDWSVGSDEHFDRAPALIVKNVEVFNWHLATTELMVHGDRLALRSHPRSPKRRTTVEVKLRTGTVARSENYADSDLPWTKVEMQKIVNHEAEPFSP